MADTRNLLAANKFPLLRRLSITSLGAMLVTAAILIFLYRQDQLAEHEKITAQENEEAVTHLTHSLDGQINTFVTASNGLDTKALRTNPNIGLFTAELETAREYDILKLKIYNLSGTAIYSSANDEIGGTSKHPDWLAKALRGEATHNIRHRDTFFGKAGEMHDVYVASVYMPLTHAGKRIGVIEVYSDATPVFKRIHANLIRIALIVFCAFAVLYAALFFAVRRTDRAIAEWQIRIAMAYAENKWLQRFFDLTPDIAYFIGLDGRLQRWNAALEQFSGLTPGEMKGRACLEFVCDEDKPAVEADVQKVFANGFRDNIYRFIRSDGALIPFHCNGTVIYNEHGEPDGFVGLGRDMSERLSIEEQIRNLAFHDALTKLPNRRLLDDRLEQTMAASKRSGCYGALMFLDLDNFKPLNDMHGHGVGDLLLIEAAHRLSTCVREVDTVARFGGDEFVVILSELAADKTESLAQAGIVAEKIRAILAEPYVLPIQQKGKAETITVEHHCTSSIGVVLFISHESGAEDILKWADMAMYQAKEGGRNLIRFLDSPDSLQRTKIAITGSV